MWTGSAKDKIFTLNKYSALHAFAQKTLQIKGYMELTKKLKFHFLKDQLSNINGQNKRRLEQNTPFLYLEGVWKPQVKKWRKVIYEDWHSLVI